MIDKDTLLELILEECDICLHLHGAIPDGGMDFRPTPDQRSTLELLRYLSFCALGGTRAMAEGNWDAYRALADDAATMEADAFPDAMARQKEGLRAYFAGLTQEDLDTRIATTPMGVELPLDRALITLPLKWMAAYRMQLFLYAKQAGNTEIWTPDCWAGVSMDRPAPTEA